MKTCAKCEKILYLSEFHKNSRSKDGHVAYCKSCMKEYAKKRRPARKRRGEKFISKTHKECVSCKKILPNSDFTHVSYCKKCMTERTLNYRGGRKLKVLKITETHKQCRICEELKPFSEYAGRDRRSRRKESYCKECKKAYGTERVLKKYGMTISDFIELETAQGGVCKICKQPEKDGKRLAVDHDHSCCSGVNSCGRCIRGLLCSHCNRTLGMAKDSPQILRIMAEYLESYK
jgi:hypothetical protein